MRLSPISSPLFIFKSRRILITTTLHHLLPNVNVNLRTFIYYNNKVISNFKLTIYNDTTLDHLVNFG
jgi:hypothetical protein